MTRWPVFLIFAILCVGAIESEARRIHLTPEQKTQLERAQTVLVEVLALTEKGTYDPGPLVATVKARLEDIGYMVTTDRSQPHDVAVKVKCEEAKTSTGTSPTGGDVELADAPDRLWKGPACLLTYFLQNNDLQWKKEVRTTFADARQAAQKAEVDDAGAYAMDQLNQRLAEYDFPVMLSAEWGQIDRLLKMLDDPNTPKLRKVKILSVLSDVHAEEALPQLTKLLESTDLQQETINALSGAGGHSIPLLIDLFQTSRQSSIRAEAAKALGDIAAKTGDPRPIPPLVRYVSTLLPQLKTSEDIDFPVLTEVVWAIGKQRWEGSLKPMRELQQKIWVIFDNSEKMAELREATSWTYKQIDLDGHLS
ncbi:HEAT repeat domain-containing protein [Candidatus Nitrospira allomarina]|jgi:HEAT repeat protein|uniref:HEAT repeat domain-containing protein n=1 Tax=Candidatus Nitrospira allomarina TaxID=3020900 RepID=A0AA96G975_9BACT|nr:HEAT repeat domain-containing protein [Candidatus Nitrospira allomarina]WNM57216.1 HEAT repeat domain-containing protein [Candidatus Nitrospira allomarina]